MSFALERYKYPGPVPGTFKQGLGFIFYLVAFRETYQVDHAGRGFHSLKLINKENQALKKLLLFLIYNFKFRRGS